LTGLRVGLGARIVQTSLDDEHDLLAFFKKARIVGTDREFCGGVCRLLSQKAQLTRFFLEALGFQNDFGQWLGHLGLCRRHYFKTTAQGLPLRMSGFSTVCGS
jgi:hypothetical protein